MHCSAEQRDSLDCRRHWLAAGRLRVERVGFVSARASCLPLEEGAHADARGLESSTSTNPRRQPRSASPPWRASSCRARRASRGRRAARRRAIRSTSRLASHPARSTPTSRARLSSSSGTRSRRRTSSASSPFARRSRLRRGAPAVDLARADAAGSIAWPGAMCTPTGPRA